MYCTACGGKLEIIDTIEGKQLQCTASNKIYDKKISDIILTAVNKSIKVEALVRNPRYEGPWRCVNCNGDLKSKNHYFCCEHCNFEISMSLQSIMQKRVAHISAKY